MKKENYQLKLQNDGIQNTLIIELPDDSEPVGYIMKLMDRTRVPGLLPVKWQSLNGKTWFSYLVSGKTSLNDFVGRKDFSYEKGLMILRNLTRSIRSLSEYLIAPSKVYLDINALYIGDGLQTYLPLLPVKDDVCENFADEMKKFYQDLINAFQRKGMKEFYEMFVWIYNQPGFDLMSFEEQFMSDKAENVTREIENREQEKEPVFNSSNGIAVQSQQQDSVKSYSPDSVSLDRDPIEVSGPASVGRNEKKSLFSGLFNKRESANNKKLSKEKKERGFRMPGFEDSGGPGGVRIAGNGKEIQIPGTPGSEPANEHKLGHNGGIPSLFVPFGKEKEPHRAEKIPDSRGTVPPTSKPGTPVPRTPLTGSDIGSGGAAPWSEGTIFIDEPAKTSDTDMESEGTRFAYTESGAELIYNGQPIRIKNYPFLLGRGSKSQRIDFVVPNSKVSHLHASIHFQNGEWMLQDQGSTNGTYLNGKKLEKGVLTKLTDKDHFKLCDEEFIFSTSNS